MVSTLSKPMAEGRTAEIHSWDDRHILKLYRDWCPSDWVDYESRIAHAVFAAGVPSPAPGKIIEVNGRRGLVYERVEGISMLQDLNARPWMLLRHARSLAELQVKINEQTINGLPSYKDRLHYDISNVQSLSDGQRNIILAMLRELPDDNHLCHGDYHPANVLITKTGPVVIDWMTACSGSRWTDVARSSMILSVAAKAAGRQVRPIIRLFIRLFHSMYLRRYHALVPDVHYEVDHWMPIVAAARLNENIVPERESLLKIMHEGLT